MFIQVLGGAAAALAIYQAGIQTIRWMRGNRTRDALRAMLRHAARLDRRLRALVSEIEAKFDRGVGWTGWAIWPDSLRGHLVYMAGMLDDLDQTVAGTRALWAEGPLERLRADVEELVTTVRRVVGIYLEGTIGSYQRSAGSPIPYGATGRGPVNAMGSTDGQVVLELRERAKLLARSAIYRLDRANALPEGFGDWPITLGEVAADPKALWVGEPRPMEL